MCRLPILFLTLLAGCDMASSEVVQRIKLDELARARVYKSADQVMADQLDYFSVSFNSEDFDNLDLHDTVTNNDRLTIPSGMGGVYEVSVMLQFSGFTGASFFWVFIEKNGTTPLVRTSSGRSGTPAVADAEGELVLAMPQVELLSGDYLRLMAGRNDIGGSGVDVTIKGGSVLETHFTIRRVGPIRAVAGTAQARPAGVKLR